jgi:glycosyltransferase involved in cell wall biosynthesis
MTKISNMHINQAKIQVIPYGIDTNRFKNINGDAFKTKYGCQNLKVILSVGRLNYQKGFQYLIQAMPHIIQRTPKVMLIIVGEGEQLQYLKQLAISLGVSKHIVFTGALSQTQIPNAYAACDVFVLPSLFESFGISLIEAQAAGKPVISTRTGGAPEALIDGTTGLLVEPADPKSLELAILRILTNDDLASEMGIEGKKFVETKFNFKPIMNAMIDCYERVKNHSA